MCLDLSMQHRNKSKRTVCCLLVRGSFLAKHRERESDRCSTQACENWWACFEDLLCLRFYIYQRSLQVGIKDIAICVVTSTLFTLSLCPGRYKRNDKKILHKVTLSNSFLFSLLCTCFAHEKTLSTKTLFLYLLVTLE